MVGIRAYTKLIILFGLSSFPHFPLIKIIIYLLVYFFKYVQENYTTQRVVVPFLHYSTLTNSLIVVNQFYEAEIMTEYVIKGNAAVLKCSIPSFVADFVRVESWIDESNNVLTFSDNYGSISSSDMFNF